MKTKGVSDDAIDDELCCGIRTANDTDAVLFRRQRLISTLPIRRCKLRYMVAAELNKPAASKEKFFYYLPRLYSGRVLRLRANILSKFASGSRSGVCHQHYNEAKERETRVAHRMKEQLFSIESHSSLPCLGTPYNGWNKYYFAGG
ncbi:hypothetical protein CBL_11002 [Carabus blaptoides fortunei]